MQQNITIQSQFVILGLIALSIRITASDQQPRWIFQRLSDRMSDIFCLADNEPSRVAILINASKGWRTTSMTKSFLGFDVVNMYCKVNKNIKLLKLLTSTCLMGTIGTMYFMYRQRNTPVTAVLGIAAFLCTAICIGGLSTFGTLYERAISHKRRLESGEYNASDPIQMPDEIFRALNIVKEKQNDYQCSQAKLYEYSDLIHYSYLYRRVWDSSFNEYRYYNKSGQQI